MGNPKKLIPVGTRFGRLVVTGEAPAHKNCKRRRSFSYCICDCGNVTSVSNANLKNGSVVSCGCYLRDISTKHGYSKHKRILIAWCNMKRRCYNTKCDHFSSYGAKGIRVCDEWLVFENFARWAIASGYKDGLTLDRINVDLGYSPQNCRWVDNKVQARNKRNTVYVTYNGETKPLIEWSEITGLNYRTLKQRLRNGYEGDELFSKPDPHRTKKICLTKKER